MPEMAYHPGRDRIFVVWEDEYAPKDYEPVPGGDLLWTEEKREVRGILYGIPPSLRVRVVESGTDNPLEGAWTLVLGPSLFTFEKTNGEGECWFDIEDNSPSAGTYLVVVFKLGCTMAIKFVNYIGSPLQETLEVVKLW
jgi:hypothetical protein